MCVHSDDIAATVVKVKQQQVEQYSSNTTSSRLVVHRSLQSGYNHTAFLSSVNCFSNRRLLSMFRCRCHGLHVVDTEQWVDTKKEDRSRQVVSGMPLI